MLYTLCNLMLIQFTTMIMHKNSNIWFQQTYKKILSKELTSTTMIQIIIITKHAA